MPELHETRMGQKLINKDVPELIQAINRLAEVLEKMAQDEKKEKEGIQIWKCAKE